MNLSPEQMQFLADKGLSLADVIEFAALVPGRSKAAERQARYRERQKQQEVDSDVTSDVTRDSVTDGDAAPLSRPPNEKISNPPTHTPPETTPRARKAARLPEDWEPKPLTGKAAEIVERWEPGELERQLAKFRNHWLAKGGRDACKLDWQRTWVNWIINHDEWRGKRNGNRTGNDEPQSPILRAVLDEEARQDTGGGLGGVEH